MQVAFVRKKLPHHGFVHFRRRKNIEYDTTPDRTDAPTIEGIFLSAASSNIKSDFLGQTQRKSTYFRALIFLFPQQCYDITSKFLHSELGPKHAY